MTSIVIPYKLGPDNGSELRYALRSLENLDFEHEVFVIGQKPEWLTNVNFIPTTQVTGRDYMVFLDTHNKMNVACDDNRVSQKFIVMYDDTYFIRKTSLNDIDTPRAMIDINEIPDWQEGAYKRGASRKWISLVDKVIRIMRSEGKPCYNWETHLPRMIDKTLAKSLIIKFNMLVEPFNFFSLYMNSFVTAIPQFIHPDGGGFKMGVYSHKTFHQLMEMREQNHVLNHGANCFNTDMKLFLQTLFPNESKYEG